MDSEIRIHGIGVISRAGTDAETLWESLCAGRPAGESALPVAFKPDFPASRLRRVNRYSKMGLAAAAQAWRAFPGAEETDPFRRGTIFATGYGSIAANFKFCREMMRGDPDLVSPTVFTGTVPNACVGTVCMLLGCRGVSTVLSGGDHLGYSRMLLAAGRADVILAGAVEEYTPEHFAGLSALETAAGADLSEASAVLLLARESGGLCGLKGSFCTGLGGFPLLKRLPEDEAAAAMAELLGDYRENAPDVIFTAANGTYFDELERSVLERSFPGVPLSDGTKRAAGETMGCGYTMNMAAAALCLSHGFVPAALCAGRDADLPVSRILVTGFDAAGNYLCGLLGI